MQADDLSRQAPFCPTPERLVHSHWMSHLPFAFWLIDMLRPSLLVELGSYQGASFCAFCQQIENLGLSCEAYAIDTWQGDANMGKYSEDVYADLTAYIQAKYPGFACLARMSFDDALAQFQNGSIDLLHIDGFHSEQAIMHDFESWLPKISDRGVILIHDICARLPGYGGVAAWRQISAQRPTFAFTHGYGLGVVFVGTNAPVALKDLSEMDAAAANGFRHRFQAQGKIYERLFALEQQRLAENNGAAQKLQAARAALDDQSARAELRLDNLQREQEEERQSHAQEIAKLRESILQAELKAQAYANSLSWKLTAPLRKIAHYFRS